MSGSGTIDLADDDLALVKNVLARHLPADARVWAFGSRVKGTARRFSDLDLAIDMNRSMDFSMHASLAEDLTESDIICRVDLVDIRSASDGFRQAIEGDMIPLEFRSDG